MGDLIANLGEVIAQHPSWAAVVLGLTTFGESMVLIGAFFPATALMMVAGGLAGSGVLHPAPLIIACVAGAVFGDAVSYWLGRRLGSRAWRRPWLRPHRRKLARARLFFRRYGVSSIYLCRFMGPVRAFVPLIAGMTGMDHMKFQIANLGSALIWVPVMLAPGYLAAKGVSHAMDGHLLGLAVLGVIAALIAGYAGRRYLARPQVFDPEGARRQVTKRARTPN